MGCAVIDGGLNNEVIKRVVKTKRKAINKAPMYSWIMALWVSCIIWVGYSVIADSACTLVQLAQISSNT